MAASYYHITLHSNLDSILAHGLLTRYATGKEAAVWICTTSRVHWAIAHTQKRHGGQLADIVILTVQVPRSRLRRAWCGLWRCFQDIPPTSITLVGTGLDLAASPCEEVA